MRLLTEEMVVSSLPEMAAADGGDGRERVERELLEHERHAVLHRVGRRVVTVVLSAAGCEFMRNFRGGP